MKLVLIKSIKCEKALMVIFILFIFSSCGENKFIAGEKVQEGLPINDIEFVILDSTRNHFDCNTYGKKNQPCRVLKNFKKNDFREILKDNVGIIRNGNSLTFVFDGIADRVSLFGGFSYPLSRIKGTDLWVLTVQVSDLEEAIIGYQFLIEEAGKYSIFPQSKLVWKGEETPKFSDPSKHLQGKIYEDSIHSKFLNEPRRITVYKPPGSKKVTHVVYMADGELTANYAAFIDTLITNKKLDPVMIVGIHNGRRKPDPDPRIGDTRALEYLINFGYTNDSFISHENFLINELIPFVEKKYLAPARPENRIIFGFSNGGSFASAMGLRHPDVFKNVINFSGAARDNLLIPEDIAQLPKFYLLSGKLEIERVKKNLEIFKNYLQVADAQVKMVNPLGGHDQTVWNYFFPQAIEWVIKPNNF